MNQHDDVTRSTNGSRLSRASIPGRAPYHRFAVTLARSGTLMRLFLSNSTTSPRPGATSPGRPTTSVPRRPEQLLFDHTPSESPGQRQRRCPAQARQRDRCPPSRSSPAIPDTVTTITGVAATGLDSLPGADEAGPRSTRHPCPDALPDTPAPDSRPPPTCKTLTCPDRHQHRRCPHKRDTVTPWKPDLHSHRSHPRQRFPADPGTDTAGPARAGLPRSAGRPDSRQEGSSARTPRATGAPFICRAIPTATG